jgi:membrane protease YdiL (CAAX protease family)
LIQLFLSVILAAVFWLALFGLKLVNFWWGMAAAAGILALWSIITAGEKRGQLFKFRLSYFFLGLISAAFLYIVFWTGDFLSTRFVPFAAHEIQSIYSNKGQLDDWKIALLLFFWIGPAEEIFWRGMVQRILATNFGNNIGWFLAALIYAAVHLWAANLVLFMAAFIAGLFWGWLYKRFGSLWPGIVSHSIWDVAIFLVLPL